MDLILVGVHEDGVAVSAGIIDRVVCTENLIALADAPRTGFPMSSAGSVHGGLLDLAALPGARFPTPLASEGPMPPSMVAGLKIVMTCKIDGNHR